MNKTRLLEKFKREGQFDLLAHLFKMARIWGVFQLMLIPLNCLANLSFRFHYHQILTYEFWTSDQVINANIVVVLAMLLVAPYIVYYEKEKPGIVVDHYLTVAGMHCLAVLLYNFQIQWQLGGYVLLVAALTSLFGYTLALKHDQDQFVALVSGLERAPRKEGVVHCQEHKTLVEPTPDDFISVEALK